LMQKVHKASFHRDLNDQNNTLAAYKTNKNEGNF